MLHAFTTGISRSTRRCARARASASGSWRARSIVAGGVIGQRARRLARGAHRQQHAPHVGVMDDRQRVLGRCADRPALHARRARRRAPADRRARRSPRPASPTSSRARFIIVNMACEPAIGLADEPADGAAVVAEGHDAGRARMDAELVLEADAAHVVARAEAAVGVDQEFRHQEERDAAGCPAGASGSRASTRCTMLGVQSCSP